MRKVKFRGKSSVTNEWVYGLLVNVMGKSHIIRYDEVEFDGHHLRYCSDRPVFTRQETIGQFTGLCDKNNKEIYEGDILGTDERIIGWVKGGVRGYCYDVVYINHPKGEKRWSLYGTVQHDFNGRIKVIGNIYDNKNLLEK